MGSPSTVGVARLADGGAVTGAAELRGNVFDHARGRHVDDHRPALLRQAEAHRQGQRQFLAEVAARLIDQGEPVGVGVEDKADVGAALGDQRGDLAQVLGNRLRRVGEEAVGVAALADRPTPKRLQ